MGATEVLLDNNRRYAADFDQSGKPMPPARRVAVSYTHLTLPTILRV